MSKEKMEEALQDETAAETEEEAAVDQEEPENQELSLEEQLLLAKEESNQLQDQILRVAAEFENYKKRMERERATMLKYAGENILRELLPVVDNLERAVEQGASANASGQSSHQALLEGVQLTLKSLLGTLEKFEVKPIESVGQPFDPTVQEALTMEASETVPSNHVISEFEKGYHYKDRLLRAARVVVSSGSGT